MDRKQELIKLKKQEFGSSSSDSQDDSSDDGM